MFSHAKAAIRKLGTTHTFFYVYYTKTRASQRTVNSTESVKVRGVVQTTQMETTNLGVQGSTFSGSAHFISVVDLKLYDPRRDPGDAFDTIFYFEGELYRMLGRVRVLDSHYEYHLEMVRNEDYPTVVAP